MRAPTQVKTWSLLSALVLSSLYTGCAGIPDGVEAVRGFDLERYLGNWYEIARLDHRFERGLSNISATYERLDGGAVRVVNRGWDATGQAWKQANGTAYLATESDVGRLKVSFFGPFYGGYNVIALDHQAYRWAMVAGPSRSYLWVLSRSRTLPASVLESLLQQAFELGFATDELIFVEHEIESSRLPGVPTNSE